MAGRLLTANAEVQLAAPSMMLKRLYAPFLEFGDVRIADQGTHSQLITKRGIYGRLYAGLSTSGTRH
ncbi:hypothetical protein [Mesorhizobium australicum]|uniref:Uncharacterized protein n=1 Tax=Mesorhizobium australicum TaxID=536018 RepID=A0A1X7NGU6_9HYPH|nr:hypothetical protein [Mesorhizobium australicum]SMH36574.1 hypothetical protein SAMN02982922_1788 [Mesorhizobium australicum]